MMTTDVAAALAAAESPAQVWPETTTDPNGVPHHTMGACEATWRIVSTCGGRDTATQFGYPACGLPGRIDYFVKVAQSDVYRPVRRCPDHAREAALTAAAPAPAPEPTAPAAEPEAPAPAADAPLIEITHTHEEGTLADGGAKGDGSGDILKRHGFRWFPSLRCWGVRNSRDRAPRVLAIRAAERDLKAAGFNVTVTLDNEVRDNATVNAARHDRLEDRRDALTAKGDKLTREADALYRYSNSLVEHIPMGQPVLPGRRGQAHRNTLERSVNAAIRSAKTAEAAAQMPERVEASRRQEARRERPDVVARRVDKMEAQLRKIDRELARITPESSPVTHEHYTMNRAELVERIAGDRAFLEQEREAGRFGKYTRENVRGLSQVRVRGQWRNLVRANAKTVSVATGYSWTDSYGYEEITDAR